MGMRNQVFELVETVWDKFEGSGQTKMDVGKIGRDDSPEDLTWDPPDLSFTIDRHGGTVMGSTRAERQTWTLKHRNDYSNSACKWVSTAPAEFAEVGCNSNCKGHLRGGAAGPASPSDLIDQGIVEWTDNDEIRVRPANLISNVSRKIRSAVAEKGFGKN